MDNEMILQEFAKYNGFYKRPEARRTIFDLFRGQCAATDRNIEFDKSDIGHIVPQSEGLYFEEMFPGLDVHNIINLHLLSQNANRRVSNHFPKSPLAVYNAISYNMRLVRSRLPKIQNTLQEQEGFDADAAFKSCVISLNIDISKLYEEAQCYGTYHAFPLNGIELLYKDALANAGYKPSDYSLKELDASTSMVQWSIEDGIVSSVRTTQKRGEAEFFNEDLEQFAQKLFYLRARRLPPPENINISDGDYMACDGSLKSSKKIIGVVLNNAKKCLIMHF